MKTPRFLAAVVACFALVGGGVALGQTGSTEAGVTADSRLILRDVNTSHYDDGGQVLIQMEFRGLSGDIDPNKIVITENGEVVPPDQYEVALGTQSSAVTTIPSNIVLVIDTSGSMQGTPIDDAKAAAVSFVQKKSPSDLVAVVTFDSSANVVSDFSGSTSQLVEKIQSIEADPQGETALFEGVIAGTDLFAAVPGDARKSMVVLTDGGNTVPSATQEEAASALSAEDVRMFGVVLQSSDFNPDPIQQLADGSEGFLLTTANSAELAGLYGQIGNELNRVAAVLLRSKIADPGQVEFGVQYGTLQAAATRPIPGFSVPTTTLPTTTTTFPLTQALPEPVSYSLPLPIDTILWLGTLGIGAATALFIYILIGNEDDGAARFAKRLSAYGRRSGLAEEKRPLLERIPLLNRFTAAAEAQIQRRGLLGAVNATLEQGNLPLSAGEAIAAGFGLAGVLGLVAGLLSLNLIVGVVVFVIAVLLVFAVINFIGGREKKRFENQLPDTLTLLSTSLRAGYSLLQAVEAVAQEAPNPTAREFGRAIAEARLGRQVTEALAGITTRTQSKDFEWAVMAIDIQREVGGNLAEVLQTVADTMMARNRLRGEIKALTAEGRISAIVLGALPFGIAGFLWMSNPAYLRPLFISLAGQVAIGVAGLLMAGGMLWLRKIVDIEV